MEKRSGIRNYAVLAVCLLLVETAQSLRCYQCVSTNSTHPFQCNEVLSDDIDMIPESCDGVFGAQYCVKHTGRFEAAGLDCYQCSSKDDLSCGDSELLVSHVQPANCSHVFEARYCIKTVGGYGDGIGTKRFCSSVDRGNYCDYVNHKGDKLTYRTCIFTCTGDGCNPAMTSTPNPMSWITPFIVLATCRLLLQR